MEDATMSLKTAAILAGGLGARLRPVLSDRPKVLAPVGGKPFLTYLLDQLRAGGIRKVILCTGYLAGQVKGAIGERYGDLQIHHSEEDQPLGTAGALRLARNVLDSDPVLVLNGDSYCEVDLRAFLEWHRQKKAFGSLVLVHSQDVSRFGRVACGPDGQVLRFGEKEATGSGWINAGVYLLSQRLLQSIPKGRKVSLELEIFPSWAGKGLFGFAEGKRFVDIGTPKSYAEAAVMLAGGKEEAAAQDSSNPIVTPRSGGRRYVLLDRDGTLNIERNHLSDPDGFELLPGVVEGLRQLRSLGLGLVVISNQSAIGRGYFDLARLKAIHRRMCELLAKKGIELDAVYFCPHRPDENCACRKPEVGLGCQAAAELGFDPAQCFVIGDKESDIAFGKRLGATTLLVRTGYGAEVEVRGQHGADYVVDDLREAASLITRLLSTAGKRVTRAVEPVRS
jgi:D,D-heptose 1,7-bisphosphate phosphatase